MSDSSSEIFLLLRSIPMKGLICVTFQTGLYPEIQTLVCGSEHWTVEAKNKSRWAAFEIKFMRKRGDIFGWTVKLTT
jgi:hypothetical protein